MMPKACELHNSAFKLLYQLVFGEVYQPSELRLHKRKFATGPPYSSISDRRTLSEVRDCIPRQLGDLECTRILYICRNREIIRYKVHISQQTFELYAQAFEKAP